MAFGDLDQTGERRDIAVHGKHAVADQQLVARSGRQVGQDFVRCSHILMREDVDLGPRKAAAVDDAGVIQRVGNDVVFGAQNRGDCPGVGGKTGLENHARFHVLEPRDALFKLHVDRHGSGDSAHGARSYAILARGFEGGFAQLGMGGQTEVIVRSQIDYFAAVEAGFGRALRLQNAQRLPGSGLTPG